MTIQTFDSPNSQAMGHPATHEGNATEDFDYATSRPRDGRHRSLTRAVLMGSGQES